MMASESEIEDIATEQRGDLQASATSPEALNIINNITKNYIYVNKKQ